MNGASYRHLVPELRIFHGPESLAPLHRELERLGSRRAVILCGASLVREGTVIDLIRNAMDDRCAGVIAGVQAHSPLHAVEAAARELQRLEADAVLAVGGGSAAVTARAASILLAEGGDARRLCTSRDETGVLRSPRLLAPKVPQLVIPTTPTTATLKAGSAVLDPVDGKRLALFDPKTRAKAVFVHPELIKTPPRDLVVSAGLNTLAMALEGLMSRAGDPFSDALLMHATRLLAQRLPEAARSDDVAVRNDLMFASLMCGHGTDYTGAGIANPARARDQRAIPRRQRHHQRHRAAARHPVQRRGGHGGAGEACIDPRPPGDGPRRRPGRDRGDRCDLRSAAHAQAPARRGRDARVAVGAGRDLDGRLVRPRQPTPRARRRRAAAGPGQRLVSREEIMKPTIRTTILCTCALVSLLAALMPARAETYPDRVIKFVAPTTPGPTADVVARVVAEAMSKVLKQTIVVENKPGAEQAVGLEYIAKMAPADGYTVGVIGIDGQALMPLVRNNLRFDPMKELTLVAGLGEVRYLLASPSPRHRRTSRSWSTRRARRRASSTTAHRRHRCGSTPSRCCRTSVWIWCTSPSPAAHLSSRPWRQARSTGD
jgi:hypothetical protein